MKPLLRTCLALCLGLLLSAAHADDAAPATWQQQKLTFDYRGFTTRYSCDGLRSKLRQVLQALGARSDLKLTPAGCTNPGRPEPLPSLDVDMWTLQPAPTPPADALPAQWRAVQLSRQLDGGDCELAEEIKRQLLPHFTVRKVQLGTSCIPHQGVTGGLSFSLEVLTAPTPQGATR